MARDGLSWAVKTLWPTNGPKSGTTSNTFYFSWIGAGTPSNSDLSSLAADVWTFWNGVSGGSTTITYYLGPQIYRASNSVMLDVYNLDLLDDKHHFGSPVQTYLKTPGTPGTSNPLPNEVAVSLSYRAAYGTDPEHDGVQRPRAQDRGRTYIGPLQTGAIATATAPNGTVVAVVDPTFITRILTSFTTLRVNAFGHQFDLSVWSRHDHQLKEAFYKAVDNSFDTQRKREVEPPGLQNWITI